MSTFVTLLFLMCLQISEDKLFASTLLQLLCQFWDLVFYTMSFFLRVYKHTRYNTGVGEAYNTQNRGRIHPLPANQKSDREQCNHKCRCGDQCSRQPCRGLPSRCWNPSCDCCKKADGRAHVSQSEFSDYGCVGDQGCDKKKHNRSDKPSKQSIEQKSNIR